MQYSGGDFVVVQYPGGDFVVRVGTRFDVVHVNNLRQKVENKYI